MSATPRIWDKYLSERDQQVLAGTGLGNRNGFGTRPALFIIDVQYNFCGDGPEDILEGIKKYRTHCGREPTFLEGSHAAQTVEPLAPRPVDMRIAKQKPSCFFGTIFMSHLNFFDVDTLILVGCSTSGCLRATAVDAYSYNFKVVIPEECAFDRFECSHAVNLFDLNCKYADVIPVGEVRDYIGGLPARALPKNV